MVAAASRRKPVEATPPNEPGANRAMQPSVQRWSWSGLTDRRAGAWQPPGLVSPDPDQRHSIRCVHSQRRCFLRLEQVSPRDRSGSFGAALRGSDCQRGSRLSFGEPSSCRLPFVACWGPEARRAARAARAVHLGHRRDCGGLSPPDTQRTLLFLFKVSCAFSATSDVVENGFADDPRSARFAPTQP